MGILNGAFINTGQVCVAVKRVYIPASIYDDMVAAMTDLINSNKFVQGDGELEGVTHGK